MDQIDNAPLLTHELVVSFVLAETDRQILCICADVKSLSTVAGKTYDEPIQFLHAVAIMLGEEPFLNQYLLPLKYITQLRKRNPIPESQDHDVPDRFTISPDFPRLANAMETEEILQTVLQLRRAVD